MDPLPRVELPDEVATDDQVELSSDPISQLCDRVRGVARAASFDLDPARLDAGDSLDGGSDDAEAVLGRGHIARPDLLPRLVRDDEKHPVQTERVTDADSGDEMTDVNRVEGTAEDAGP